MERERERERERLNPKPQKPTPKTLSPKLQKLNPKAKNYEGSLESLGGLVVRDSVGLGLSALHCEAPDPSYRPKSITA